MENVEQSVLDWTMKVSKLKNHDISGNLRTAIEYRFPALSKVRIDKAYQLLSYDLRVLYEDLTQAKAIGHCRPRNPEDFLSLKEMLVLVEAEEPYRSRAMQVNNAVRFQPDYRPLLREMGVLPQLVAEPAEPAEPVGARRISRDQINVDEELLRAIRIVYLPPIPVVDFDPLERIIQVNPPRRKEPAAHIAEGSAKPIQKFTCEICLDGKTADKIICCEKKHCFCHDCVNKSYTGMITGDVKVISGCFHTGCESRFDNDELGTVVPAKTLGKIRFKKLQTKLKESELYKCPYCPYYGPKEENEMLQCLSEDCARLSCIACQEDHEGKTCEEAKKTKKVDVNLIADENLIRPCPVPSCRNRVLREDGCSKMKCSCGRQFCWVCSATVKDYSHFCDCDSRSHRGWDRCSKCGKCGLYATNMQDDVKLAFIRAKEKMLDGN